MDWFGLSWGAAPQKQPEGWLRGDLGVVREQTLQFGLIQHAGREFLGNTTSAVCICVFRSKAFFWLTLWILSGCSLPTWWFLDVEPLWFLNHNSPVLKRKKKSTKNPPPNPFKVLKNLSQGKAKISFSLLQCAFWVCHWGVLENRGILFLMRRTKE